MCNVTCYGINDDKHADTVQDKCTFGLINKKYNKKM